MKAGITDGKGRLWLEDLPLPEPGEYQCLCKNLVCATCTGTDKKIIQNALFEGMQYPGILGHESVGVVVETGRKVRNIHKGDIMIRPTAVYPQTTFAGFHSLWGAYAEYGLVTDTAALLQDHPETVLNYYCQYQMKLPADLGLDPGDAVMLITLKEVLGYADSIGVRLNMPVMLTGVGSVGLTFCHALRLLGAYPVIVAARRASDFELALKLGADYVINTSTQDLKETVMEITKGHGVDRIIDATGNVEYVKQSLPALSENGRLSPYATYPSEVVLTDWIPQEKILEGVTGEVRTHDFICSAVRHGQLNLADLYSHRLPFEDLEKGFELIRRKEAFKIVFDF